MKALISRGAVQLTRLCLLAVVGACGCQRLNEKGTPMKQGDDKVQRVEDRSIVGFAKQYARDKKGWKDEDVEVVFEREQGDNIVLKLIHKDDKNQGAKGIAGGGKSVQVWVDVKEMKVVRELHYQ
jgi:hypothetical protein